MPNLNSSCLQKITPDYINNFLFVYIFSVCEIKSLNLTPKVVYALSIYFQEKGPEHVIENYQILAPKDFVNARSK